MLLHGQQEGHQACKNLLYQSEKADQLNKINEIFNRSSILFAALVFVQFCVNVLCLYYCTKC